MTDLLRAVMILMVATSAACDSAVAPPLAADSTERPHLSAPGLPLEVQFPGVTKPADVFYEPPGLHQPYASVHGGGLASRFVLYRDSTMALQYQSVIWGFFQYPGRYQPKDSVIELSWDSINPGHGWFATGRLKGDSLDIKYSLWMGMSDFLDGVYIRAVR